MPDGKSKPNPAIAIRYVERERDRTALEQFRDKMAALDASEIVAAIDQRIAKLGLEKLHIEIGAAPAGNQTLESRVQEALRVHEQFLAHKNNRKTAAARTRDMIKRWGAKEAVRRTVANMDSSSGLELLAAHGRLDCAYEQIILDFPDEFDAALRIKAQQNLDRLRSRSRSVPTAPAASTG